MKIGFGLVGCGMIANFHAKAIENIRGARIAACTDTIPASVERFATANLQGRRLLVKQRALLLPLDSHRCLHHRERIRKAQQAMFVQGLESPLECS